MSNAYEKAGVNIEAGYESVERMKSHVARTVEKVLQERLAVLAECSIYLHLIIKSLFLFLVQMVLERS